MKPLVATHWAPIGPTEWTVRLYLLPGCRFPLFDLFAFAKCLKLSRKQIRAAGMKGVRKIEAFNKNGEIRPTWIAPPAAATALLAKARELGRPGVDEIEADFAAAFHAAMEKTKECAA